MIDDADRPTRPRLTVPFWLSLLLFVATSMDVALLRGVFVATKAYRQDPTYYGIVVVAAALIWLWVVGATRRYRQRDFEGPVQTVRGRDSAAQPVLAAILLIVAAFNAHGSTVPKLVHVMADQRTTTLLFETTGAPQARGEDCALVPATNFTTGPGTLCVPDAVLADGVPAALDVTGRISSTGFWVRDIAPLGRAVPASPTVSIDPMTLLPRPPVPRTERIKQPAGSR